MEGGGGRWEGGRGERGGGKGRVGEGGGGRGREGESKNCNVETKRSKFYAGHLVAVPVCCANRLDYLPTLVLLHNQN